MLCWRNSCQVSNLAAVLAEGGSKGKQLARATNGEHDAIFSCPPPISRGGSSRHGSGLVLLWWVVEGIHGPCGYWRTWRGGGKSSISHSPYANLLVFVVRYAHLLILLAAVECTVSCSPCATFEQALSAHQDAGADPLSPVHSVEFALVAVASS